MRTILFLLGICTGVFAALDPLRADDTNVAKESSTQLRGSYYVNGEIHVGVYGQPEGAPLTKGHWDFKPSWSKTGDMLVFFRRLKNDPDVSKWKTAIHVINADGTGLHQLSDGTHTDFNQTWTRDGTNTPIWNRKNPQTGGYQVMASKVVRTPATNTRSAPKPITPGHTHAWPTDEFLCDPILQAEAWATT